MKTGAMLRGEATVFLLTMLLEIQWKRDVFGPFEKRLKRYVHLELEILEILLTWA